MSAIAEKLSQAGQLDNMIRQQNSVVDIILHGVNFIQMAVGFVHLHKSLDALIQGTFIDQIWTRAVGSANSLLVDRRPFTKLCGSVEIDSGIGHRRLQSTFASVIAGDKGSFPFTFAISQGRPVRALTARSSY
jgi:hypothetical protein